MDRNAGLLREWWIGVLSLNAHMPAVVALWFGIVQLETVEGATWSLYVNGCGEFDPEDENADWAGDQLWLPSDRYTAIPGSEYYSDRPYGQMLEYVSGLIRSLSPQDYWPSELKGVAVGYDDGDFVITYRSDVG